MFYRVDSTRVTLREWAGSCPWYLLPLVLPFVAVRKLLRLQIPIPGTFPDSLTPFRVDGAEFPEEARQKIAPLEQQLQQCGFIDPVYHWVVDPSSLTRMCLATFRHRSGTSLAQVLLRRVGPRESLYPEFLTAFRDGTYFETTAGPRQLSYPPSVKVQRAMGASVADLWRLHNQDLSLESFGKTIETIDSTYALWNVTERCASEACHYYVERGVFVPCGNVQPQPVEPTIPAPVAEGTGESTGAVAATPVAEIDPEFAEVYQEIERQANQKASWTSAILTLLVTVAIFFAVGWGDEGWQSLLLIAGVLFLHELGHLIVMWQFRYRNLRMFFIPFFGAAVSGQNYNVPGWKKAIVSLMGPLPGIVLGAALGIVAAVYHWPAITGAALVLLAINAFNLLPIMPLDGGQIAHAVLFSRHPTLDVAFRAVAALLLVLSGLLGTRFLALLGISMFVGLPTTYRVGKVVRRLRKSGFDASSHDDQTIPMETAQAIHSELKGALPAQSNAKTSATLTLRAFELLNARPPGWLASCALLGVHGLTLLAAVVVIIALILLRHGGFRDIAKSALLDRSKHAVDSSRILTWSGAKASQAERKGSITISADLRSREDAEAGYRDLTAKLPPEAGATAFGETVLVTLPAGDKEASERLSRELRGRGENVFVGDKTTPLALMMTCSVPTVEAAEELEDEIAEYVGLPSAMYLVPPWSPDRPISAAERKARHTFLAIQKNRWGDPADPRRETAQKELAEALRRGDVPAVKDRRRQLEQLRQTLHKEYLARMRKEGGNAWDVALIEQYEKTPEPEWLGPPDHGEANDEPSKRNATAKGRQEKWEEWAVRLGSRLGQLPMEGKTVAVGAGQCSAQFGAVDRVGSTIYINVCLECPSTGAPALAHWLSRRGCTDLRYDFCPDDLEGD